MATILEFRHDQRSSTSAATVTGRPAEIVFFPGVRYERHEETSEQAAQRQRNKRRQRRRDRLEIDGSDH